MNLFQKKWHWSFFILLLALVFQIAFSLYLITDGSFNLSQESEYSLVFWDMWQQLMQGKINISPEFIKEEGYLVNGLTYAYQLPLPALIRGILSIFGMGHSAVLSAICAHLIFILATCLVLSQLCSYLYKASANKLIQLYFQCALIIAPADLFLMTYPRLFSEVMIWAVALFVLALSLSITLLIKPSAKKLFFFTLICSLTLYTRATFTLATIGLFLMTVFLCFKKKSPTNLDKNLNKKICLAMILFILSIFGLAILNYAKWGNPLVFYPFEYYKMLMGTNLLQQYIDAGGPNQLNRIPGAFAYYFFPSEENFIKTYPYLQFIYPNFFANLGKFTYDEPTLPLTLEIPIYLCLSLYGFYLLVSRILKEKIFDSATIILVPAILSSLLLLPSILTLHGKATRYQGDLLPILLIMALIGMTAVTKKISKPLKNSSVESIMYKVFLSGVFIPCITLSLFLLTTSALIQNTIQNKTSLANFSHLNEKISFSNNPQNDFSGLNFVRQDQGWQEPESWGVWSKGDHSTLRIPSTQKGNPKSLILEVQAFTGPTIPEQRVNIMVNGKFNQTVILNSPVKGTINIDLKSAALDIKNKNLMETWILNRPIYAEPIIITFAYSNARSPISFGNSTDNRILAMGLISATFKE